MEISARQAIFEAQKIAFAPYAFQAARIMRDQGLLKAMHKARKTGISTEALVEATGLTTYAVETLCESGLAFKLCTKREDGKWAITRVGHAIERDSLTRVHMDLTRDVCYLGLDRLETSLLEGRAAGLEVLGDWSTLYEGLSQFPEKARDTWLKYDHFFSDGAFNAALKIVLATKPKAQLDVGGNTGKGAMRACRHDPDIQITIADLPGQLKMAKKNLDEAGFSDRVSLFEIDVLDPEREFPGNKDSVWMSQFLVCFSKVEMVSILERARRALTEDGSVWILDTYWDLAQTEMAEYCLQATSLYFTAIANGTSRMYSFEDTNRCIELAGLEVVEVHKNLGLAHTLLRCRPKKG